MNFRDSYAVVDLYAGATVHDDLSGFTAFVVIRITPLAASEPYNADAAAPFNTVMFSMSFGLMSPADEPPPRIGIPSIINKGSLFCPKLMDEIARMMIWELELGEPPLPDTCTPAIFPCREFTKFADCPAVTSSAFRLWTAKFSFSFLPEYPSLLRQPRLIVSMTRLKLH